MEADADDFQRLVGIMRRLRGPGGCPWDRQQTHESLAPYAVEEAYEVADAVASGNSHKICEELGDLLLQVVFHAVIAEEDGRFGLYDVAAGLADKLVRRHPHVFEDVELTTATAVSEHWDAIKRREERAADGGDGSTVGFDDNPLQTDVDHLPALMQAQRVQEAASEVGFDWDDAGAAAAKIDEEQEELRQAVAGGERRRIEEEIGDLLFAVVNVTRLLGIEAETALDGAVEKFRRRFAAVSAAMASDSVSVEEATLAEMEWYWQQAKGSVEGDT